ncbi:MAG: C39 family peptidase, partial [Candidatus Omnitrophica bacterium]|nr:C39 family peptidase [Candidatus Omnitrophota bacterium]
TITAILFSFNLLAAPLSLGFGPGIRKEVKSFKDMRQENVVSQSLDFSCGPAALATVLSYYFEDEVSEKEIINFLLLNTSLAKVKAKKGFSLLDLKNFATYRGYEVKGFRMDFEFLVGLDKPVLLPVNIKDYSHFVIFRGISGDRVFLADPALGNMTMKTDKFQSMWQAGIGLVLSKADHDPEGAPLAVSEEERAVFADSQNVRKIFGINNIGPIYSSGEF